MYAGNVGTPQNLESFINIFSSSKKDYKLTIYGSGSQFDKISDYQSENLTVNSFIHRDELIKQTKDIPFALVSLSPKITIEGFPGKTFDYLKMNKILIGYSNPDSSLANFIEQHNVGINISPNEKNLDSKIDSKYFQIALLNINHWAKRTVNDYLNRSINHYENLINSENYLVLRIFELLVKLLILLYQLYLY